MHPDLSKAYDLLGVKPGVSNRELKAAHRDLAKVWHPDRFLHDPRLQEKAQEKLKEINEAYELLISGKVPKASPSGSVETVYSQNPVTRRRPGSSQWTAVPLLIFVAVFAITITFLLQRRQPAPVVQEEQTASVPEDSSPQPRAKTSSKPNTEVPAPEQTSSQLVSSEPTAAVATVTVNIDPESGLLAKQDCPVRSRMTYPSGSEPTGYCNLNHAPPPKESKIKSIAKSVGRALD
ncbi:MAG TPA: J domain-containing protein [Pyrinomonadaceae bacterium]